MKLVFHVGLHRAASTSFRRWLNDGRDALAGRRIVVATGLAGTASDSPFACLIGERFEKLGPAAAARLVESELARLEHDYEIAVISDENLPGMMPGRSPLAFEARDRLAGLFEALRQRHQIVPVLILRQHVSWLISCYRMYQWRGELKDFEQFVRSVDAASLEFAPLVTRLAAAAGGSQPVIGTLDAIAGDLGGDFLRRFAEVLGTDAGLTPVLPVANASRRPLVCALVQESARLGGALALAGAKGLWGRIARLSDNAAARNSAEIGKLADIVAVRWVEMPGAMTGRLRRAAANAAFAEPGAKPVTQETLDKAMLATRRAVASLDRPLAPPQFLAALAERYAADRRRIAERYAPQWLDKEGAAA